MLPFVSRHLSVTSLQEPGLDAAECAPKGRCTNPGTGCIASQGKPKPKPKGEELTLLREQLRAVLG